MINFVKKWLVSLLMPEPSIPSSQDLSGKVIIVTGASRGIGKAVAHLLTSQGAIVIGWDSTTDIRSYRQVARGVEKVVEQYSKIDVVVNCAGIFLDKPLDLINPFEFEKVIKTNVAGPFNLARSVVPYMKKYRSGLIINIGSKISHNTNVAPNKVAYATSKYALEGFSFALNKELKGTGVRVCCLMPGTVATFVSRKNKNYLSPYDVAALVAMIIQSKNLDFESIVFKSIRQNI